MAIVFLVFMALILILAAATMNLGEVARLKTSTAKAADAGALAGASWMASGDNELAEIAKGMWINVLIVQAIFAVPFCNATGACLIPPLIMTLLWLVNNVILKGLAADPVAQAARENALAATLFTAIQNLHMDVSGCVPGLPCPQDEIDEISGIFEDSRTVPLDVTLDWFRSGAGGAQERSWARISFNDLEEYELILDGWDPIALCLVRFLNVFGNASDPCVGIPVGSCNPVDCCLCLCITWVCPGCIWPCFSFPAWTS
ncbi:MAG: hypothetical protein L0Y56_20040, partial [Nitrospira sp.]|nr:hypothetical protein [Nitrospira sp.]